MESSRAGIASSVGEPAVACMPETTAPALAAFDSVIDAVAGLTAAIEMVLQRDPDWATKTEE